MNREIYLWQKKEWPSFVWDDAQLSQCLARVHKLQGQLVGSLSMLGFDVQSLTQLEAMIDEVQKSSEIEGEFVNADSLRSSIARQLGIAGAGDNHVKDHYVEGLVEIEVDASVNYDKGLTFERLFCWHAALFPTGFSGIYRITVGDFRKGNAPMQVVSGPMGKEKVHYLAPPSDVVPQMMQDFIDWVNKTQEIDLIIKAAVAHLWFVSIHPFDDGNGRLTRTITDMLLARADGIPHRFYSVSAQICHEKKSYYEILEQTQKGTVEITPWLKWFVGIVDKALTCALNKMEKVIGKHRYWQYFANQKINERQHRILNMLWDGFEGKLTSSKWAKISKCSQDTALRDIHDLIAKGMLKDSGEGGRSANYILVMLPQSSIHN